MGEIWRFPKNLRYPRLNMFRVHLIKLLRLACREDVTDEDRRWAKGQLLGLKSPAEIRDIARLASEIAKGDRKLKRRLRKYLPELYGTSINRPKLN